MPHHPVAPPFDGFGRCPAVFRRLLISATLLLTMVAGTAAHAASATRTLPATYTAGTPVTVSIATAPDSGTVAYAVEDSPPAGWTVAGVTGGGIFDSINGKVKWGPFFDNTPRTLTYQATPGGASGTRTFTGKASFDGAGAAIGGAGTIADGTPARYTLTTTALPAAGGMVTASPAADANGQYAEGTVVTLTATANASYNFTLWGGDASGTASPVQVTMSANRTATAFFIASGSSSATRSLPSTYLPGQPFTVTIMAAPAASTSAYALEETPPAGWAVSSIDNGGVLDTVNGQVKWGPFFDDGARTLSYQQTPPAGAAGTNRFSGTASFDGRGAAIAGSSGIDNGSLPRHLLTLAATPVGAGSITASPLPGNDGQYEEGTVVTLTAVGNSGYAFTSWSGDASGSVSPLSFTVNANRTVTATFDPAGTSTATRTLPATYSPGAALSVSIAAAPRPTTASFVVEETPPTGWTVSNIDNGGVLAGGKVTWSFPDHTARTLTYRATPPGSATGTQTFAGQANFGIETQITIGGNTTVGFGGPPRFSLTKASNPAGAGVLSASPQPGSDGKYAQGTVVTVSATAASGFYFMNFSGDASSTSRQVQVTMNADRSLTANYGVAATFKAATYYGLVHGPAGTAPLHAQTGFITVTTTRTGVFTAQASIGGKATTFRGLFDASGTSARITVKSGAATLYSVVVHLDVVDANGLITGDVDFQGTGGSFSARRNDYNARTNPAALAGNYTLLLPPLAGAVGDANLPQGSGAGRVVVSAAGIVTVTATLADGTAFSRAVGLAVNDSWPLYGLLYGSKGFVAGTMAFADSDLADGSGTLDWFKPPVARTFFPDGITMQCAAMLSTYTYARNVIPLAFVEMESNATFTVTDGDLALLPNPRPLTLTKTGSVTNPIVPRDRFALTIALTTGLFSGSFPDPVTKTPRTFQGALFQKQAKAAGFYRGTAQTGEVTLSAAGQ